MGAGVRLVLGDVELAQEPAAHIDPREENDQHHDRELRAHLSAQPEKPPSLVDEQGGEVSGE